MYNKSYLRKELFLCAMFGVPEASGPLLQLLQLSNVPQLNY